MSFLQLETGAYFRLENGGRLALGVDTFGVEGLRIEVDGVTVKPLRNKVRITRSLDSGASLSATVRGARTAVSISRGDTVQAFDIATNTLVFSGHVIEPKVLGYPGDGDLVDIQMRAAGIEQQLFRRVVSEANARALNGAANAAAQLGIVAQIAGSAYSAGNVHGSPAPVRGVTGGVSLGRVLESLADIQRVRPGGSIDAWTLAGRTPLHTFDREAVDARSSDYSADVDTTARRVYAVGQAVEFVAVATMNGGTPPTATIATPQGAVVVGVSRVESAVSAHGTEAGQQLSGYWDQDRRIFVWQAGTLATGQTLALRVRGRWRYEAEVTALVPDPLAGDVQIQSAGVMLAAVRADGQAALDQRVLPVETMRLGIIFRADVPWVDVGGPVAVALALQQELDVYRPNPADVWVVNDVVIEQPAPSTATRVLTLSRGLADRRSREFWTREDESRIPQRSIVVGDTGGVPQISQLLEIPPTTIGRSRTFNLNEYFSDEDEMTFTATSSASGIATAAVDGSTLTVTGIAEGTARITVTANDGTYAVVQIASVEVIPNRAPVVSRPLPDLTDLAANGSRSYLVNLAGVFSDVNGDPLSLRVTIPANVSVWDGDAASGQPDRTTAGDLTLTGPAFVFRPSTRARGTLGTFSVRASDGRLSVTDSFNADYVANRRPALSVAFKEYAFGPGPGSGRRLRINLDGHFTDADGDHLRLTVQAPLPWSEPAADGTIPSHQHSDGLAHRLLVARATRHIYLYSSGSGSPRDVQVTADDNQGGTRTVTITVHTTSSAKRVSD